MRWLLPLMLIIALVAPGCSAPRMSAPGAAPAPLAADALPAAPLDPRAGLALNQIEPAPRFGRARTVPDGPAPLEALDLYARARDARYRNQHYVAVSLLEQAVQIDPDSFELHYALGSARQNVGKIEQAIEAYEHAAQIRPDDLVLQAELGRAYMQRGDVERGIAHLRLARLTDEYQTDEALAAAVDHRLAVALQQGGYDRAALEMYEHLLERLGHPTAGMRVHPEIVALLNRPEFLVDQIGRLHERQGRLEEALRAYQFVASRQSDDFPARARVVRTLLTMGRGDDAVRAADEIVRQFRASPEALDLLRETYAAVGRGDELVDSLLRLHAQRPADRMVLFALAGTLWTSGQTDEAARLMIAAADERQGDPEILSRLVSLQARSEQFTDVARVVVEAAARRPHRTSELLPLLNRIVAPSRERTLRIADFQRLAVPADAEPARLYFLSRIAGVWSRPTLADAALRQSVAARPIFAPAFRAKLSDIWNEARWNEDEKLRAGQELVSAARAAGDEPLALELTGINLLGQKRYDEARTALRESIRLGNAAPDAVVALASAHRSMGEIPRFEQLMWKLLSDHSQYLPGYPVLFGHYIERGNINSARTVLSTWISRMPEDVDARILEAGVELRFHRDPLAAERLLLRLYAMHPHRADVLVNIRAFYTEAAQPAKFIQLMESERDRNPHNVAAVTQLVDAYVAQQRLFEAGAALDDTRAALDGDADRLYMIAHLYHRVQQPQTYEQVLEQILAIDPDFAPAANDLGYTLAEAGRRLDYAESLVRRALEAEPHNPMFLDSLGWVLYKQGQFDEARRYLEESVSAARSPDPVVLDHLGDVLYRLGQSDAAVEQWRQAHERLGSAEARETLNALRLQLEKKLAQADRGEPVSVAPVVSSQ